MADTVFRTKEEVKEEPPKKENIVPDKQTVVESAKEPVPYTEYKAENGKPYTAKHFELGDNWEVFNEEVSIIEEYLNRKIDKGEIANDVKIIEKEIRKMEKLNNVKDEPRAVVKIATIASYIRFLNESDGIRINWRKYAST